MLNGTVYTEVAHQRAVLAADGLSALLPFFCDAVPFELQEQALLVMLNATSINERSILGAACDRGAVAALQRAAGVARANGREEALGVAFTVLANLAEGCAQGRQRFTDSADGVSMLLSIVGDANEIAPDVRSAAANLLLALCSAEPSRQLMLQAGARRSLEHIASWDKQDVLAARAKQALREL